MLRLYFIGFSPLISNGRGFLLTPLCKQLAGRLRNGKPSTSFELQVANTFRCDAHRDHDIETV